MSLKTFTAWQPSCDVEGCKWFVEGDGPIWFTSADEAADGWRDSDGWVNGDRTQWICDDHKYRAHGPVILPLADACDRCGIELDEHAEDGV